MSSPLQNQRTVKPETTVPSDPHYVLQPGTTVGHFWQDELNQFPSINFPQIDIENNFCRRYLKHPNEGLKS